MIGDKIREFREEKDISLRELSRILGLSHTYIDSLEKGRDPRTGDKRTPSPKSLKALSEITGDNYISLLIEFGYLSKTDIKKYIFECL